MVLPMSLLRTAQNQPMYLGSRVWCSLVSGSGFVEAHGW